MTRKPEIRFAETNDLESLVHLWEFHSILEKSEYNSLGKAQELNRHLFSENPALYCLIVEMEKEIIGYPA